LEPARSQRAVNLWREAPVARAPPGAPWARPGYPGAHDRLTRGQGAQALQAALQAVKP
jgi:hypothetical protein